MPLKVLFYKKSDIISSSIYEQLLLDTNKSHINDKSSINTQHCPLYNQDGTTAGTVIWNYNVYQNIDESFYNESGLRTLILYDGFLVSNYSYNSNFANPGYSNIVKATFTSGIYNSIYDVYISLNAFDDLRQLTIFYQ